MESYSNRKNNNDVCVIIPAYNPDEKFISFLKDLDESGYCNIIVVNDGSIPETDHYFYDAKEHYKCHLLTHSINLGQGRAYKTAFNYYLLETKMGGGFSNTIGIIQCDCDGQHYIDDINRCSELLRHNPEKFILGVRDFSDREIPLRSRFGNRLTNFVFKFFCGLDIKDTQTGLKGIPKSFINILMKTTGERFEYASSVLLETKRQGIEIMQFPIKTIYINGNETSHFNPLIDSLRIYSLILRFLMSSLSASTLDIIFYGLLIKLLKNATPDYYIYISTYISRIVLCIYVFFINKKYVFYNKAKDFGVAVRFFALCALQASLSALFVKGLVLLNGWNEVACKIPVDIVLFFFSFQIQSRWVFRSRKSNKGEKE